MSKRSKRRHRQENRKNCALLISAVAKTKDHQGGSKRRIKPLLLVASLIVVAAAVLFAVNGVVGRKAEPTVASNTNSAPSSTSAPAAPMLSATPGVPSSASASGPKISFATLVHDFGQIKGGDLVRYTYIFTNVGDRLLEVTNVQASCGCTTAGEWSRKVEPGQTGSIPIEFNSGNFNGQVAKSITVTCNDTKQPTVVLQFKGSIWRPIDVTPQFTVLNVNPELPSNTTTVRIVSNLKEPLTVSAPESSNPAFGAELGTNQPGKEFQLTIRTVPPLPASSVQGQITVKTSSTNMPVITVGTWVNVQQVITVIPSQIILAATPLANLVPSTVSIRNNGTNTLTLSEPAVNAKGVDVQLKEIEPGRFFTLTVSFPAQFEAVQGGNMELSVKSNHPQFPVIKVPVVRPARPVPVVVPAPSPATQAPFRSGASGS